MYNNYYRMQHCRPGPEGLFNGVRENYPHNRANTDTNALPLHLQLFNAMNPQTTGDHVALNTSHPGHPYDPLAPYSGITPDQVRHGRVPSSRFSHSHPNMGGDIIGQPLQQSAGNFRPITNRTPLQSRYAEYLTSSPAHNSVGYYTSPNQECGPTMPLRQLPQNDRMQYSHNSQLINARTEMSQTICQTNQLIVNAHQNVESMVPRPPARMEVTQAMQRNNLVSDNRETDMNTYLGNQMTNQELGRAMKQPVQVEWAQWARNQLYNNNTELDMNSYLGNQIPIYEQTIPSNMSNVCQTPNSHYQPNESFIETPISHNSNNQLTTESSELFQSALSQPTFQSIPPQHDDHATVSHNIDAHTLHVSESWASDKVKILFEGLRSNLERNNDGMMELTPERHPNVMNTSIPSEISVSNQDDFYVTDRKNPTMTSYFINRKVVNDVDRLSQTIAQKQLNHPNGATPQINSSARTPNNGQPQPILTKDEVNALIAKNAASPSAEPPMGTKSQTMSETKSRIIYRSKSQADIRTESQAKSPANSLTKSEAKTPTGPQTQSQTKPRTGSQKKSQTTLRMGSQTKSQSKSPTGSQTKSQSKSPAGSRTSQSISSRFQTSQARLRTGSSTNPQTKSQIGSETKSHGGSQAELQTGPCTESQAESLGESLTESRTETPIESEAESRTEPHSNPAAGPEGRLSVTSSKKRGSCLDDMLVWVPGDVISPLTNYTPHNTLDGKKYWPPWIPDRQRDDYDTWLKELPPYLRHRWLTVEHRWQPRPGEQEDAHNAVPLCHRPPPPVAKMPSNNVPVIPDDDLLLENPATAFNDDFFYSSDDSLDDYDAAVASIETLALSGFPLTEQAEFATLPTLPELPVPGRAIPDADYEPFQVPIWIVVKETEDTDPLHKVEDDKALSGAAADSTHKALSGVAADSMLSKIDISAWHGRTIPVPGPVHLNSLYEEGPPPSFSFRPAIGQAYTNWEDNRPDVERKYLSLSDNSKVPHPGSVGDVDVKFYKVFPEPDLLNPSVHEQLFPLHRKTVPTPTPINGADSSVSLTGNQTCVANGTFSTTPYDPWKNNVTRKEGYTPIYGQDSFPPGSLVLDQRAFKNDYRPLLCTTQFGFERFDDDDEPLPPLNGTPYIPPSPEVLEHVDIRVPTEIFRDGWTAPVKNRAVIERRW